MAYVESGVTDFSTCSFQFYDLYLREVGGQPVRDDAIKAGATPFGGGYHYRVNAQLTSSCRNRSIIWRYHEDKLEFVELSLDVDLANPGLRVHIPKGCGPVVPGVSVVELASSVVIMFATVTSVFRLALPHPESIAKDPSLASAGKGLQPSIFTFVFEDMLTGCNRCLVMQGQSSQLLTSCASGMLVNSSSLFALGSPNGSIYCVLLPPLGEKDGKIPERFELKSQSMMRRLWSLLPVGGSGVDQQCPVDMEVHLFSGELIILALCQDVNLRLWSCQQRDCLMEHSLVPYFKGFPSHEAEEQRKWSVKRMLIHKVVANGEPDELLKFAVCLDYLGIPQILVFQLELIGSQLVLDHLSSHGCPPGSSIVSLSLTNDKLWVVFTGEEGMVAVKCFGHGDDDGMEVTRDVVVLSPPSTDVILTQHKDPREAYLDEIFRPGQFSLQSIRRALQLFGSEAIDGSSFASLHEEVTVTVEEEVKMAASSHELTHSQYRDLLLKCWSKFYTCCLQYEQLVMKPLGLSLDAENTTVILIRQETMSFIHSTSDSPVDATLPLSTALDLALRQECEELPGEQDVAFLLKAIRWITEQVASDVLVSYLVELDYHENALTMAEEIAEALLTDESSGAMFTLELQSVLNEVLDLPAVIHSVMKSLQPSLSSDTGEVHVQPDAMDDVHVAATAMFSSTISSRLLAAAFRQLCQRRLAFCQNFLLMLCTLEQDSSHHTQLEELDLSDITRNLSRLVHCYHSLYWLSTTPSLTITTGTIEVNLRQLAALDISSIGGGFGSARSDVAESGECSLVELYLSNIGHEKIFMELITTFPHCLDKNGHVCLGSTHPLMLDILLKQLWPLFSPSSLYEFLMANCQYSHVQALDTYIGGYIDDIEPFSRHFVMGQSYVGMGQLGKAFQCFLAASGGLRNPDEAEPLLQRVALLSGAEADGPSLGAYWVKVMRLFEQVPSPQWIVGVASVAVQAIPSNHPTSPLLWSNLFKYSLELGHYQKAYNAMMGNPDPDRRIDCLKHFVVVLTDHGQLKQLCEMAFSGMEEEVEQVMEQRARSVDILGHKYYNLLYCYHTSRGNLQRAASFMYEQGLRLGLEAPGPSSLQKQANCYVVAITSLKLVKSKYAWIVRPVDVDSQEMEIQGGAVNVDSQSKNEQKTKKKKKKAAPRVKVLSLADMEKEYQLVKTKLQLLHKEPSLATQLCHQYVSLGDVQTLLLQAGLYDIALTLSRKCGLSVVPVFESLAGRCAYLTANLFSIKHGSMDTTSWDWLGVNETSDTTQSRESGIIEQAWSMLRHYLEKHSSDQKCELQGSVARKLLSVGSNLPQWMVGQYMQTNPAELLRLYLSFDQIEAATNLAVEYIDAMLGHGKEYFGLKTALHATCPSVWLPYSSLDHLMGILRKAPPNSPLEKLSLRLKVKLDVYLRQVDGVSERMRREAIERLYQNRPA